MKKVNPQPQTIAWIDLLRIVACFLVVLAHCCDPFVAKFDGNKAEFLSGAYWGSLLRPCVPLFVMISGVLLLPVKNDVATFYSRRLKKIIIPLVFWSIITPILYFLYLNSGVNTLSPNIIADDFTLSATLHRMYLFVFNFSYETTPLWYIYMLVGIYLFLPIIGAWLNQASQKDVKRFLWIWGISMVLPYVQMAAPLLSYMGNYGNMGLLGVCDWNPYGTFYYFSGFLGYIVFAHYLIKYPLGWSWKHTLCVTIPLFVIGYLITSQGFILTQQYFPGSYANLEIVWYFSGINVFMMTIAIFIIFQKIDVKYSPLMSKIAKLTFGVYLCHFIFVQIGYDLIYTTLNIPAYLKIPVIAIFAFLSSLFVVWILWSNQITKKVV